MLCLLIILPFVGALSLAKERGSNPAAEVLHQEVPRSLLLHQGHHRHHHHHHHHDKDYIRAAGSKCWLCPSSGRHGESRCPWCRRGRPWYGAGGKLAFFLQFCSNFNCFNNSMELGVSWLFLSFWMDFFYNLVSCPSTFSQGEFPVQDIQSGEGGLLQVDLFMKHKLKLLCQYAPTLQSSGHMMQSPGRANAIFNLFLESSGVVTSYSQIRCAWRVLDFFLPIPRWVPIMFLVKSFSTFPSVWKQGEAVFHMDAEVHLYIGTNCWTSQISLSMSPFMFQCLWFNI